MNRKTADEEDGHSTCVSGMWHNYFWGLVTPGTPPPPRPHRGCSRLSQSTLCGSHIWSWLSPGSLPALPAWIPVSSMWPQGSAPPTLCLGQCCVRWLLYPLELPSHRLRPRTLHSYVAFPFQTHLPLSASVRETCRWTPEPQLFPWVGKDGSGQPVLVACGERLGCSFEPHPLTQGHKANDLRTRGCQP